MQLCVYSTEIILLEQSPTHDETQAFAQTRIILPAKYLQGLNMHKCRRITFERNQKKKTGSCLRVASLIWPDSFSIILDIIGRFGVNRSGAIGSASLRRRNHVTSGWTKLSILRGVLIVGYRSMTAVVILGWERRRDIATWGDQDRKCISRIMFGSDMS